jgi:hypothetical protein
MTETLIRIESELAARIHTVRVPFPLDETVSRLRVAIGPPEFDTLFTDASVYARVTGPESIDLFIYGGDWEPCHAELNRILARLRGRALV